MVRRNTRLVRVRVFRGGRHVRDRGKGGGSGDEVGRESFAESLGHVLQWRDEGDIPTYWQ
jgi:hypothetical protein